METEINILAVWKKKISVNCRKHFKQNDLYEIIFGMNNAITKNYSRRLNKRLSSKNIGGYDSGNIMTITTKM